MHADASAPSTVAGRPSGHNVFLALVPDDSTRARMATAVDSLRAGHALQGRWLKPERWHMTLHFLGTFSQLPLERIASARRAAASVESPAFELVLDRLGHFAKGVGWLGCTRPPVRLLLLWEVLRKALVQAQVDVEEHAAFKPHVTVLRDARGPLPSEPIEPVSWPVREFVLIDSLLGQRGEYRVLDRWELHGS